MKAKTPAWRLGHYLSDRGQGYSEPCQKTAARSRMHRGMDQTVCIGWNGLECIRRCMVVRLGGGYYVAASKGDGYHG